LLIESRNWDGFAWSGASRRLFVRGSCIGALSDQLSVLEPGTPPFVIEQRARPRPAQSGRVADARA
jgi:hypothetical protein